MRRTFTRVRVSGLALLLAAAVGAGCSADGNQTPTGGAGTGGTGGTGGSMMINCGDNQAIDPTAIVDDMEAPDYMTVRAAGRTGSWWAGGDPDSPGASITPSGDAAAETIPGGR